MLAALWPRDAFVILGQVDAGRKDKETRRGGDQEIRRLDLKYFLGPQINLLVSVSPGLLVFPLGCHNWATAGKVDAFNQKELPRVCRRLA